MDTRRKAIGILFCAVAVVVLSFGHAGAASGITGAVASIDVFGRSMAVKWNKAVVVFDLKNPELKGYKTLGDIRKGDTVTVGYVKDGIRIAKGAAASGNAGEVRKAGDEKRNEAKKSTRDGRVRVAARSRGTSFEDVDENRDGCVSAAELSQIVPGLTMQQFRQCDGNGDGRLDAKEFYAMDPKMVKR